MNADDRIRPAWLEEPALQRVLAALSRDGQEVRFVGGCVRDTLAGRPVKDIDLATPDPPDLVIKKLADAGLKAAPTGLAHGTVTAICAGKGFEVTTLRHDLETDGRYAKVGFTDDWQADAARRDLTFNAMSLSPDGRLFDPFGGAADLAAGRVRFVGKAAQRIMEDHLRLLRFFRFYAYYGRGPLDADARAAAKALAPKLQALSVERLRDELLRILAAPDPLPVLREMRDLEVLAEALPEACGLGDLGAFLPLERQFECDPDALLRLACLIDRAPPAVAALGRRLKLSNLQRRFLQRVTDLASGLDPAPSDLDALLHREGRSSLRAALLLSWAAAGESGKAPALEEMASVWEAVAAWRDRDFPLTGQDLLAAGVPQGPRVGTVLAALEDWWLTAGRPDRAACLAELNARLRS
jgi:poly(A) polymerase